MSTKYSGGFITKNPVAPTSSAASGIWTLDQQQQAQKAGTWPAPPNYIEEVFSTYLYTGNSTNRSIVNDIDLSGKGGLVWIKDRNFGLNHTLFDTARGATKFLSSDNTNAESSASNTLTAFNSNGFNLGTNSGYVNGSGYNYVSWSFRKQPKFFDVVTLTYTSGAAVFNHSLGSTPGFVILKVFDGYADNWWVYHRSLGNDQYLNLNLTSQAQTSTGIFSATSTTFTVKNGIFGPSSIIAYLYAHDAGGFGLTGTDNVISCGSVTYDSTNGNTINLGYEAQFVILKSATAVTQWYMQDIMRGMASGPDSGARLFPNLASAEDAAFIVGPTATGFNIKPSFFSNGNNVIYIAIRRGPMKTPTVGTSVFSPNTTSDDGNAITTGFPVDMFIEGLRAGNAINQALMDRLRGNGSVLTTSSAAAQNPVGEGGFASNTTIKPGLFGGGSPAVVWNFRRAPGFFDEVCYTGTGTPTNFTHNLGAVPELMIVKRRDSTSIWAVYAAPLATAATSYLELSEVNAVVTGNSILWNSTAPTSTVFTIGPSSNLNTLNSTNVAYLFATVAGVSKVGSYTGTGALLTVNCGFTSGARFVLIKRTDDTGAWFTYDSARGITSGNDPYLLMNSTAAEVTGTNYVDTDTTGFQVTAAAPAGLNASGGNYIFLAIA
jgi:hypothetical protein